MPAVPGIKGGKGIKPRAGAAISSAAGGPRSPDRELGRRAVRLPCVRRITEACGEALGTGRSVPIQLNTPEPLRHSGIARNLRAVLEYERGFPHRGTRAALRRALREQERRGYASRRYSVIEPDGE